MYISKYYDTALSTPVFSYCSNKNMGLRHVLSICPRNTIRSTKFLKFNQLCIPFLPTNSIQLWYPGTVRTSKLCCYCTIVDE